MSSEPRIVQVEQHLTAELVPVAVGIGEAFLDLAQPGIIDTCRGLRKRNLAQWAMYHLYLQLTVTWFDRIKPGE